MVLVDRHLPPVEAKEEPGFAYRFRPEIVQVSLQQLGGSAPKWYRSIYLALPHDFQPLVRDMDAINLVVEQFGQPQPGV